MLLRANVGKGGKQGIVQACVQVNVVIVHDSVRPRGISSLQVVNSSRRRVALGRTVFDVEVGLGPGFVLVGRL